MADAKLSEDAMNVLTIVKELSVVDKPDYQVLEMLFANRGSDDLAQSLLSGKEQQVAKALFAVATHVAAAGPLGYTLRFTSDLMSCSASLCKVYATADIFGMEPCLRFLEFADTWHSEPGITRPANFIAACILRFTPAGSRQNCVQAFLNNASRVLSSPDFATCRDLEYMVHTIAVFVKTKYLRNQFRDANLVPFIPKLLTYVCSSNDSAGMVQLMYEVLLVAWILSYDYKSLAILAKEKFLAVLHRALQRAVKEKCIRMAILILKNFVAAQKTFNLGTKGGEWVDSSIDSLMTSEATLRPPTYFSDMIGIGILKTLWQLQRKKYGDEDIPVEIDALAQLLESNLDELTSFSEYKGEIDSKVLEWSPVHTSAKFWKENFQMFEKNNYEVLNALCALLDSQSQVTVAVACHDIGELVRYHPNGRLLLQIPPNNPKAKIMTLMSHTNPDIARNALLAVQKIMVQRWEFLQQ
jgi:V-type H+-transporting ATPase subunit H